MTVTETARPQAGRHRAQEPTADAPEDPWVGTGILLRLDLRLDRVRVAVWTLAVALTVAGTVAALLEAYPTQESLQARAALMGNPAAVLMTGPAFGLDGYTFGAMVANELSLWVFLAAAVMSILLTVRHTRAEEEAGRLETVRALPVGRYAPAAAALLAVALADLAVGAGTAAALLGTGMAVEDSLAFGAATALTGLVFGAVAAVTAQLTEHARAASGMALAVLGAAFLVRGVGDVLDNQGSWLSWASPLAWAQQTKLYVDLRWWPLGLSVLAAVVLLVVAAGLARQRDVGAGIRPAAPGAATAVPRLLSPAGLAARLLRGSFWGWTAGAVLLAVAMGALASSLEDAVDDIPMLQQWLELGGGDLLAAFAATLLGYLVVAAVAFSVSAVLRLRVEESAGRAEGMLVTGSSRTGLLAGWLAVVAVATLGMLLLSGLALGLGMALTTGQWRWPGEVALAALAFVPGTFLLAGVAVALYGLAPRLAGAVWAPVLWVVFVMVLGQLLQLPPWLLDTSPVTHTGLVPSEDPDPVALAVMGALATVLVLAGFAGLRRRDVGTA